MRKSFTDRRYGCWLCGTEHPEMVIQLNLGKCPWCGENYALYETSYPRHIIGYTAEMDESSRDVFGEPRYINISTIEYTMHSEL